MLFLSLRPEHAANIIAGTKTVELRRTRPRAAPGIRIALYAATPIRAVVGSCKLDAVHAGSPDEIWRHFGERTAVTRARFDTYFKGAERAIAIEVSAAAPLNSPINLERLRDAWGGFTPPQTFTYLEAAALASCPIA